MDRLACVEVPELGLQILLQRHPEWTDRAVARIERDSPQARILQSNARARARGIAAGLRYGEALSIEPELRAETTCETSIDEATAAIAACLQNFSPEVEVSADLPGVFWLNATGLVPLYPSLDEWARRVRTGLAKAGWQASVAVGFTRFGTYAATRMAGRGLPPATGRQAASSPGIVLFGDKKEEEAAARRVSLDLLDLPIELRSHLSKLGVRTVGTFLRLPPSGLLERFGAAAQRLHRLASGRYDRPLEPRPIADPVEARTILDQPVASTLPLLAVIQRLLAPLLERLAGREQAAAALHILLTLDSREHWIETLRPAAPTLDAKILLDLIELRLHGDRLPAGVVEIGLCLEVAAADREQLRLFAAGSRRDLRAGARALARLRAEFGEEAAVRAKLREGHLPEARFAWEPIGKIERACPRRIRVRPLVRRIRARPQPLPSRPASERIDNWLLQDPQMGAVTRSIGPYLVSGGWWLQAIHREYYFVETLRGDLLWLFYDRRRRLWQLQGRVE